MVDLVINNAQDVLELTERLKKGIDAGQSYKLRVENLQSDRTLTQNRAMHKYFSMLAKALNEAGLDMVKVLSAGAEIPWSEDKVKDDIWRKVMIAVTGKTSTKDLDTKEVNEVYMIVSRHLSQKFGVNVEFPSFRGDGN